MGVRQIVGRLVEHARGLRGESWPAQRVIRGGVRWNLDPEDHTISRMIWLSGKWDYRYARLLTRIVPKRALFVDVGAHIGSTTVSLAMRRPDVTFACFEPEPKNYALLRANIEDNHLEDRVATYRVALGPGVGESVLYTDPHKTGEQSLFDYPDKGLVPGPTVPVRPLDEYDLKGVGFLKVDTQGSELGVVEGGYATIKRDKPVLYIEYHPKIWPRYGGLARIDALGYETRAAYQYGLRPIHDLNGEECDLLCYPREAK